MRFIAKIEYDGSDYHGWQRQLGLPTVQAALENAFSRVAAELVTVVCAGRTDAGVHASGQIIHFDTNVRRSERAWVFGTNANLPATITVCWVKTTNDDFHARFSAIARRYHYYIYNHAIRSPLQRHYATWHFFPLDATLMHKAAQRLVGEHDFNAFRAKQCQATSPVRTVEFLNVMRQQQMIILDIKANAFLHHMVRNIAGVLMMIGSGKAEIDWIDRLLLSKNRADGGITAPPQGLNLRAVYYPEKFSLE